MPELNEKLVTVSICNLKHEQIEKRFDSLERLIKDGFDKLDRTLNGNGKPGLCQRVDRTEFDIEQINEHLADDAQEKKESKEGFRFWVGPVLKVAYPFLFGVIAFAAAHYIQR